MIRSTLLEKEIQAIQIGIGAYFVFGVAGAVCINSSDVRTLFYGFVFVFVFVLLFSVPVLCCSRLEMQISRLTE